MTVPRDTPIEVRSALDELYKASRKVYLAGGPRRGEPPATLNAGPAEGSKVYDICVLPRENPLTTHAAIGALYSRRGEIPGALLPGAGVWRLLRPENYMIGRKHPKQVLLRLIDKNIALRIHIGRDESFGWLVALQTGPASFTKAMVNLPINELEPSLRFDDGLVATRVPDRGLAGDSWRIPLADESDLFHALGIPFIPPHQRTAWRLVRIWNRHHPDHPVKEASR